MKNHYRTIVISDVHLGTKGSKAKEITKFLKRNTCEKLIMNGDIIDGWQLKKYGKWQTIHTQFFRRILKCIENNNTEVIYLRGNHDDFLDHLIPFKLGCISIQNDYILESGEKRYYVIHGDIFDSITTNLKWIAKLGDIGYTFLLWLNQSYNNYRAKIGLPYYSLSQVIKSKVKSAVNYVSKFEIQLVELAKIKKCDGIICGHIHQPALKEMGGILYMNSGDWVETLSALVENKAGEWSIVYFKDESGDDSSDEAEDLNNQEFDLTSIAIQLNKETNKQE
jgi:UDP-2,3-diacylglucosamine pyrophosphatase LpxH